MSSPTTSPFAVGTVCALINTRGWGGPRINKVTVYKVRKDGKFFIRYGNNEGTQMWKPHEGGFGWEGRRTGDFYGEHLEVWTEKHDALIAEQREQASARDVQAAVLEQVRSLGVANPKDRAKLAAILGLLNKPEE